MRRLDWSHIDLLKVLSGNDDVDSSKRDKNVLTPTPGGLWSIIMLLGIFVNIQVFNDKFFLEQ